MNHFTIVLLTSFQMRKIPSASEDKMKLAALSSGCKVILEDINEAMIDDLVRRHDAGEFDEITDEEDLDRGEDHEETVEKVDKVNKGLWENTAAEEEVEDIAEDFLETFARPEGKNSASHPAKNSESVNQAHFWEKCVVEGCK